MLSRIKAVLRAQDIENLIALGAPEDEYVAEAEKIASALAALPENQLTEANIVATMAVVWGKHFSLSEDDIKKRMDAFQRVADSLLQL